MSVVSVLFGENDRSLPPRVKVTEREQHLLEGRLLKAAFAVSALAIVAFGAAAADSFVKPADAAFVQQRVAPAPLI